MGAGGVGARQGCYGNLDWNYLRIFDPRAFNLRSIFWLSAFGGQKRLSATIIVMELDANRMHQDKEGVRVGFTEGGQTFGAAGIGHRGEIMSRKEAILNMRQILINRRDALRKALAGDLSMLNEIRAQSSGDVVDAALDSVQDEISSQLAEVESRELSRIEYALERMREGQFGICEGCGTNIPMARLNALPYATYCIRCQREAERQGANSPADVDWSRLLDSSGGDVDLSINDIEMDVS